MSKRLLIGRIAAALSLTASHTMADGTVAKIVSSPLTVASTVQGARLGINRLPSKQIGSRCRLYEPRCDKRYGTPAGGRIEIETAEA